MQSTYKYRFDHSTIYWTLIYIIVFVLLGGLLYHLYEGGYLSAWFTSFIVALVALMSLSIPRKIVVSDETVEVRCLLDITEIRRDEIASVRRVDPKRMKWFLPIFGGCGFFGYYGHFIDLRRLDRVRLYASEWRNFVEITDIYEDRLYVSCADADRLVVNRARRVQRFLSQPFTVAEQFTGVPGAMVAIEDTIKGFKMILDGEVDYLPEPAFLNVGTIEEAIEKGKKLLEQANK